ncbi:MAG: hypothetical protein FWC26_09040 [Fibromonadales bacterium]|nr:hypothetical protein [Fibromonadales bacterium]
MKKHTLALALLTLSLSGCVSKQASCREKITCGSESYCLSVRHLDETISIFDMDSSKTDNVATAHVANDSKCGDMFALGMLKSAPELIETLKVTADVCEYGRSIIPCGIKGYESDIKCTCVEIITCDGQDYCLTHKCPNFEAPISIFGG